MVLSGNYDIHIYCFPGKCDGPLLEGVDGDVVGGEVAQVVEELVLHRRRQRPPEVLDVCEGIAFIVTPLSYTSYLWVKWVSVLKAY